eukprot:scaffold41746_cov67-Phaeocystis_antarctica.AAC.8
MTHARCNKPRRCRAKQSVARLPRMGLLRVERLTNLLQHQRGIINTSTARLLQHELRGEEAVDTIRSQCHLFQPRLDLLERLNCRGGEPLVERRPPDEDNGRQWQRSAHFLE